jgi:uncharacterized protein YceK
MKIVKKISINLLVVIAVLMSGCAKTVWRPPSVPGQQVQRDLAECQRNAETKSQLMKACMTSKGYYVRAAK